MANLKLRSMAYEDFIQIPVEERDYQTIYSLDNGDLWIMNRNVGNDVLMMEELPETPIEGTLYIKTTDRKAYYWDGEWHSISGNSADIVSYTSIKPVKDYLYEIFYSQLDYANAYKYFEEHDTEISGACSSIRNGDWYGRNFDWIYSENAEFIVKTDHAGGRYATMGVTGSIPNFTDEFVKSGKVTEDYKVVPFFLVDGINEKGLVVNSNVAPQDHDPSEIIQPTDSTEVTINSLMIPRYLLDHFATAYDAVVFMKQHMAIFMPKSLGRMHYELHFMVADASETYLVEFVDNRTVVVNMTRGSGSSLDGKPYMTNFYLNDVDFNADGKVYTPGTQTDTEDAHTTNHITNHGSGLERYNYIVENYANAGTKAGMRSLLDGLKYTNSYKSETNPFWFTEFVGGNITVASLPLAFDEIVAKSKAAFENRSRDPESEYYGTWQTEHSVVYDIAHREMYIIVQEDGVELHYNFDYYWTVGETKTALENKQDVLEAGKGIKIEGNVVSSLLDVTIGKDITTTETVGGLDEGTTLPSATTLARVLEMILAPDAPIVTSHVYFGVSKTIPDSVDGLEVVEVPGDIVESGYVHFYVTNADHVIFACDKDLGEIVHIKDHTNSFELIDGFVKIETEGQYMYVQSIETYDPDGSNFRFYWR